MNFRKLCNKLTFFRNLKLLNEFWKLNKWIEINFKLKNKHVLVIIMWKKNRLNTKKITNSKFSKIF